MNCEEFESRILDYQDNQLNPGECGIVEEHLVSCPDCRTLAEQLQKLDATLARSARIPALPLDFKSRLRERIRSESVVIPEPQREERKRQLRIEYEARLVRLNRFALPRQVMGTLGVAVLAGLAGWQTWLALPRLANLLPETGLFGVDQVLFISCAVGAMFVAVGFAAAQPQRLSRIRSVF